MKLCEMVGVRQHGNSGPVELWRDEDTGRLVVRAYNEGGYSGTDVDLLDLVAWLQSDALENSLKEEHDESL